MTVVSCLVLRFPRVFWVVGSLAVLLALPSVRADLYTDDQGMVLSMEGVVATLAFAGLFRRARRALGAEHSRTMAWLGAGALLGILPGIASIPGDRVLFLPDLAFAPALAIVFLHAGAKAKGSVLALVSRLGVGFFALVHVVLAPLLFGFGL